MNKSTPGNLAMTLNHAVWHQEQLLGGWRSLDGGLLHKALRDPTKAADQHALLQLLSQALGIAGGGGEANKFDPQGLQEMEVSHAPCMVLDLHWCTRCYSSHIDADGQGFCIRWLFFEFQIEFLIDDIYTSN